MERSRFSENKVIFIFALVFGFTFMNRLSINYVLPVIEKDLAISGSDIGLIVFISTIVMAISAIIVGIISDKQGKRRKFLAGSVITVGVGSMLSIIADSFTTFLLARMLVGIGFGPVLAMVFSITEKVSSENKFGTNTGFILAGGECLATILAPIVITQLAVMSDWQMSLCLVGIPTVLVGLAIVKFIPDVTVQVDENLEKVDVKPMDIFKYANIFTCILLAILTLGAFFAMIIYAPLYFEETLKVDLETIGIIASSMGLVSICYTFIVPRSTDKFGRKPVLIIACLACAIGPLFMYLFTSSYLGLGGFILLGGLAGSIHIFFNTIIPIEGLPNHLKASGSAILMAVGEILGSGGIVYLAGILADNYGYPAVMLFSSALFFLSFVIAFALKESNKAFNQ